MEKVSIIIPCKKVDSLTKKCVKHCLDLDYDNFEIILLPDSFNDEIKKNKKLKVFESGEVKPSAKRNLGMKKAKGKFFAFMDSDAYPERDWLKNAVPYFKDEKVGIVGGPNLTPPNANFWERVSGHILSNFWVSGKASIRYKVSKNQETHELPTCNYLSRREASSEYDSGFLTAEDSEFCFECIRRGYKILYSGDVVVYHHRRDSFEKHLKQMWIYARDIAWLTKKKFALKDIYYSFLSLFVIGFFVGAILSFFFPIIAVFYLNALIIYFATIFILSIHEYPWMTIWVFIGSVLTHFYYGFGYLSGLIFRHDEKHFSER
tara:strand:- start:2229 stop:3185 length:957 start_codon:yes stop_codon:yes gene_type:complete